MNEFDKSLEGPVFMTASRKVALENTEKENRELKEKLAKEEVPNAQG